MSEDQNVEASVEQPTVPSLDDVVAEFAPSIPESAQPAAAPVEPKTTEIPQVPTSFDPLDEASAKQFAEATAQSNQALLAELQDLRSTITQKEEAKIQEQVNADINSAVDTVSESAGLDNKNYVQFRLEQRAQENEGFRRIWDNRHQNPAALDKALEAISHEMKNELDFKADPQLAENHRAASQSQQVTTAEAPKFNNAWEEKLASADSRAEKDRIWAQLKRGG